MASAYLDELNELLGASGALLAQCWQVRETNHSPEIRFDQPLDTLTVSLTGSACALRCAHCNGVYLQHMHTLEQAANTAAPSMLISGGCDPAGRVPVKPDQLHRLVELKARGCRLNWHVGLINESEARQLAPLVDVVSFDIVGDVQTAREVYGLDLALADYMRTYDMLCQYMPVMPHITIGLHAGKLRGELNALQALAERHTQAVVFLVLIPTPGTAFADCPPPALDDVLRILCAARLSLPAARLYLGCMRPHGEYRQACDALAIRSGFNVIVNPPHADIQLAAQLGLTIRYGTECCALT